MQKKKLNHLLLNSLIESDFLFLKNYYFLKNINALNVFLLNNKNYVTILNPLEALKTLKQYIRLIQFFKKQKNPVFNFFVQTRAQKSIINNYILLNKLLLKFKTSFKFLVLKGNKTKSQLLLSLQQSLSKNLNLYNTLINEQIFLIQEFNSSQDKKNLGIYKIYNNIVDYKKLIFLLVILGQVWNKNISTKSNVKSAVLKKINPKIKIKIH